MAKQDSVILLRGTLGNLNFYTYEKKHYCRFKASFDRERWYTDPVYKKNREIHFLFLKAIKFASCIYLHFPKERKKAALWRTLVKFVFTLTQQQLDVEDLTRRTLRNFDITSADMKAPDPVPLVDAILQEATRRNLLPLYHLPQLEQNYINATTPPKPPRKPTARKSPEALRYILANALTQPELKQPTAELLRRALDIAEHLHEKSKNEKVKMEKAKSVNRYPSILNSGK